jgi:hypothetical protein
MHITIPDPSRTVSGIAVSASTSFALMISAAGVKIVRCSSGTGGGSMLLFPIL